MLMIWSSRPRNRSLDPVVSCFFGRMLPSAAATESQLPIRGNPRNEFASFRGFEPQKLAFLNRRIGGKQTLAQGLTSCSRPTKQENLVSLNGGGEPRLCGFAASSFT